MRTFNIPAMYAPLVIKALAHLTEARVDGHQALERLQEGNPNEDIRALASLLVSEAELDRSLAGDLVITIAVLPEDADVLAFPVDRQFKAAS